MENEGKQYKNERKLRKMKENNKKDKKQKKIPKKNKKNPKKNPNPFGTKWNQFVHGRAWTWIFRFFVGFWCFGCCLTHVLGTCYFVMSLVGYFEFEWMTFYFENFGRRLSEL